jgi:hypothetical protein
MLCAVCLWLVELRELRVASPATTTVSGTALCQKHTVEAMRRLSALQQLGVR